MVIPARNGAWNRFGSVAVVQFQRSVCKNAAKRRGESSPFDARSAQPSSARIHRVRLVVPEHLQRPALVVVVHTSQPHQRRLPRTPATRPPPPRSTAATAPAPARPPQAAAPAVLRVRRHSCSLLPYRRRALDLGDRHRTAHSPPVQRRATLAASLRRAWKWLSAELQGVTRVGTQPPYVGGSSCPQRSGSTR